MILARMYKLDASKAAEVTKNLVDQLQIKLDGDHHLTEQGWADVGVEILALGSHRVGSIDIKTGRLSSGYSVHDLGNQKLHVVGSIDQINESIIVIDGN